MEIYKALFSSNNNHHHNMNNYNIYTTTSNSNTLLFHNYLKPDPNAPPKRGRGRSPKPKAPEPAEVVVAPPRPCDRPSKPRDLFASLAPSKKKSSGCSGRPRGIRRGHFGSGSGCCSSRRPTQNLSYFSDSISSQDPSLKISSTRDLMLSLSTKPIYWSTSTKFGKLSRFCHQFS